jgi:hypothetical protein
MARRIVAALTRALRVDPQDKMHIHAGPDGRPYVCEAPTCTSPSLDLRDQ